MTGNRGSEVPVEEREGSDREKRRKERLERKERIKEHSL